MPRNDSLSYFFSEKLRLELILALHRLSLRSRQRLHSLPRARWRDWRNRRSRSNHRNRSLADLNRSLVAVHHQLWTIRSDRSTGARFLLVIVDFDLLEVALNLAFTRPRLHLDRSIRRNRNLHIAFPVIYLDIPRLVQSHRDRPV